MSLFFARGDFNAYKAYILNKTGLPLPDSFTWSLFIAQTKTEYTVQVYFAFAIIKSIIYPITFLLQLLCLIYLVRGNSGYSRSARNWFIMAVSADICSFLYLVYELLTQDWHFRNPYTNDNTKPANDFMVLMWGLRDPSHTNIQNIMCKVFFILIYFPIYLSPIALTISGMLRSYSVKYPLRAKSVLTRFKDRVFMLSTAILALLVSAIVAGLTMWGESKLDRQEEVFGIKLIHGVCRIPNAQLSAIDASLLYKGYIFMLSFWFLISALNMISAVITIWVLFDARAARKSMTTTGTDDSNAEIRATMKLLGINIVIFVCFFLSRLFLVLQFVHKASPKLEVVMGVSHLEIILPMILERLGTYFFFVPYCVNWVFIVGFDRNFYGFICRCFTRKSDATSSIQMKTGMESVAG